MNQEFPRRLLGGDDVGFTRNSIATSFSRPFTRTSTNSDQNRVLIDDGDEDSDDDDSSPPLARDCSYSRPFLFLEMIWNLAFVATSVLALLLTVGERPSTPLRFWVCGYALQCLLHVGFVWDEYLHHRIAQVGGGGGGGGRQESFFPRLFICSPFGNNSFISKLESMNSIASSVWWVFGFYWIVIGGQTLVQDSPRLYWLSVVFLAFDVFFMIFCIAMACIVFVVLFCCFPALAAVAYAMTIGDGASEDDIRSLPKYLYRLQDIIGVLENEKKQIILQPEDSECCICLLKYVDGEEVCMLPCNHHFHRKCVTKWLRINATCPLCKFNILRGDMLV